MKLSWTPEYSFLPRGRSFALRVLVSAEPPSVSEERAPLNLALVLDRSGSMRGEKLAYTLESAAILVDHMSARDRISIVFYDSEVETVIPPSPVERKEAIKSALEGVRAKGTTNLSGGWLQGIRLVEKTRLKGAANRVMLMTDGLANRGITDVASLKEIAAKARRKGVITTTLGFGKNFNEDLLAAIASVSGGNFHYIAVPDDAPAAFSEELGDLMGLAAQNLQARFEFGEGVAFKGLMNSYPSREGPGFLETFPGDVFRGEKRTLLVALEAGPFDGEEAELFRARFEFDDLSSGGDQKTVEIRASLPVREGSPPPSEGGADMAVAAALFLSGEAKAKARDLADRGERRAAAEALEEALAALAGLPPAPEVERERGELKGFIRDLRAARWGADDRKSISASIYRSQIGRLSAGRGKRPIVDTRVEKKDDTPS